MDLTNSDETFDNWGISNDPDWLTNALALDNSVVAASEDAAAAGLHRQHHQDISARSVAAGPSCVTGGSGQSGSTSDHPVVHTTSTTTSSAQDASVTALAAGIIICPNTNSIPPGRQAAKVLKCGIAGCNSAALFDRKFELQRHMKNHGPASFACPVDGCSRQMRVFARTDKLREHMRKSHDM